MARPNDVVAELLREYADLISITGGEAFEARVYEKASRAVAGYPTNVSTLDAQDLQRIPNVGKSIAEKITEFLHAGQVRALEQLRAMVPAGVLDLTRIPTLGPKEAMLLYEDLGVSSIEELRDSIHAGKLEGHRGFGLLASFDLCFASIHSHVTQPRRCWTSTVEVWPPRWWCLAGWG